MKKLVWILLVAVLALMPAGALFAQDAPPVLCGDLEAEDCEILETAAAADSEVTEASYDFEINFELSDIPELPFEQLAFNWVQQATYVTDPALSDKITAYVETLDADAMGDVSVLSDVLSMVIGGVDTQQAFVITLADETASLLSSEMGMPIPTEFGLEYALIDGVIYVNVSDLAEFIPELAGMPFQGWVGTELAPILDLVLAEVAADPEAMAAMGPIGAAIAGGMGSASTASGQPEAFDQFVSVTRLDDDEIDGEPVAVFETVFDFVEFASSPEFIEYVKEQVAMAEMMGADAPSEADIEEMEEMMPQIAPMVFEGLNYSLRQAIGEESGYTLETDSLMEWDLSSVMAMADAGDSSAYFGFSMETNTYDQNNVGSIEPPEGAFVVPAQMLLSMMGG